MTATGVLPSNACPAPGGCINWNRSKQGPNPTYQNNASADLNLGPSGSGCDGAGTILEGHDDWSNILYRSSAALDFAGGARSDAPVEMTSDQEQAFFAAKDADSNGVGDATDCGPSFTCTHRIDIKPSFPIPKTLGLGQEANVTIAIFSEKNGSQVWNASTQVLLNNLENFPLTFSVGSVVIKVKVNNNGGGTCSISDVPDLSGQKDGIKDLKCQFSTSGLPTGTHFGVVSGFFRVNPSDPNSEVRAFSARQEVTLLP